MALRSGCGSAGAGLVLTGSALLVFGVTLLVVLLSCFWRVGSEVASGRDVVSVLGVTLLVARLSGLGDVTAGVATFCKQIR